MDEALKVAYEKLKEIRGRKDLALKPNKYLKDTFTGFDGQEYPFKLRYYQVQGVLHMVVMNRFLLGDDTGTGKCQPYDSLVLTDRGLLKMGEIEDWSDMTPDSFRPMSKSLHVLVDGEKLPIKSFYYGGVKSTVTVHTRYGFKNTGSQVHPMLVLRDGSHQWVQAKDLIEGDYLCIERREMSFPESEPKLIGKGPLEEVTPDFARFVGYYIGRGTLIARDQISVSQYPVNPPEVLADIIRVMGSVFNKVPSHLKGIDLSVCDTRARRWLVENGMGYLKSAYRDIPDCILQASKTSTQEFLRAFFEGAGHVDKSIELTTTSKTLGEQLQVLLLRFGVVAKREKVYSQGVYGQEGHVYWRLTICDREAEIFRDQIGFVSSRKKEALNALVDCSTPLLNTSYFYDPVVEIEQGEEEVFDIEVDDPRHCFVSNGFVNHNTAMAISSYAYVLDKEPNTKAVVLTNKSVVGQWALEFEKFTKPGMIRVIQVSGTPKKREAAYEEFKNSQGPTVMIMGYATARQDVKQLQTIKDYILITDEASAYKNPSSQIHQVVRFMANQQAKRVWALTATLIKNNLVEGYGIYSVLCPGLFPPTKNAFINSYAITRMQKIAGSNRQVPVIVGYRKDHIENFRNKIDPFFLSRSKMDVASELPVLTIREDKVALTPEQQTKYQEALDGLLEIDTTGEQKETTKLTSLIYCQQIVDHPDLIDCEGGSYKMDHLFDILTEGDLAGEKVIVFSRFRKMIDLLEKEAKKKKITSVRITGAETKEEVRKEAMQKFQDPNSDVQVCFITTAAAEGINLQAAKAIVFFDSPWSAGDYLQCLDEDTEILTQRGFVGRTSIKEDDLVAAMNTQTSEIEWQPIRSITDRPRAQDEQMYEVSTRHVNIRVTGGHRMLYRRKTLRNNVAVWPMGWEIETAEQMAVEKTHYQIPAAGEQNSKGLPLTQDQLEFIGWFLSDGSLNKSNHQLVISQAIHQPQIVDLRRCIENCGFDWSEYNRDPKMTKGFPNGKPQIVFSIPKGTQNGTRARKGWKELEPYLDKELSPLLEDVTPEQLSALLRGLHLGDGSKYRGDKWNQASYHIFTGRKVFAERLQSLCVRRGFRCNLSIRQAAPGRKEGYTLHIKKTNAWSLCGNKKMIGRSHMSPSKNIEHERVWCVENDLGTLVTRRRGKVAVVGNCIGRMIRIGSQHDRCYAIHLVASGTIDEDVIVTLKKKMKLVEKIMGKRLKGEKDQDAVIEAENDISDLFDSVRANARTRKYK